MKVVTTSNKTYSYSPKNNEIVCGENPFLSGDGFSFKSFAPFYRLPNLDSFILNLTEQCNLRCSYCCYSGIYKNNRIHSSKSMTESDIPPILQFIDRHAAKFPIIISFYGGEPLLQYDLLKKIILLSENQWGKQVEFYVGTNATLLTFERIDWLVKHKVLIAISVDGAKRMHDRYRKDRQGKGSFDQLILALSYIKQKYPAYLKDKVFLLTTVVSFNDIPFLAESWHQDHVLHNIRPSIISSLAPNFRTNVQRQKWEDVRASHEKLLNLYDKHRDWLFLKSFFDGCIKDWKTRPIMDINGEVPLSTCLPSNNKLFVDSYGDLYVCEKFSNCYPIGNVSDGVDWKAANDLASRFYIRQKDQCKKCPAIRMCSLCLTSIEFNKEQMDVLCHNERIYTKINFWLFCEMAERGMIE